METNRKLLFFDIDGTLLTPYPWTVPDSARKALKEAHANGHLIFINSGRIYAMIPSIIKEMGFDGYVCGCGSQIYMNDKLLFSSMIPNDLCRETIEKLRQCKVPAFFEHPDKLLYCSKATGIQFLAEKLNVSVENTFAFGDSTNDLPMLQYAGNSIAMGHCDPLILPHCTYQTSDILDNGIANALKHFHLIP